MVALGSAAAGSSLSNSVAHRTFGGVCAGFVEFLPSQRTGLSLASFNLVASLSFPRGQGIRRHRPTWSRLASSLRTSQGFRRRLCRLGRAPTSSQGPGLSLALSNLVASLSFPRGEGFRRHRPTWPRLTSFPLQEPRLSAASVPAWSSSYLLLGTRALVGVVQLGRVP